MKKILKPRIKSKPRSGKYHIPEKMNTKKLRRQAKRMLALVA